MHANRFRQRTAERSFATGSETSAAVSGFMVCPLAAQSPGGTVFVWQQLYQLALERSQAATRPSLVEWARNVACN